MKLKSRQRGLAIVEFTIALPVLLILLLGASEFGYALYQYNTLTKCVRDGARYLSQNSRIGGTGLINITDANNNIATKTKNVTVYGDPDGGDTPLLPSFSTGNVKVEKDGENVRVTVDNYQHTPISNFIWSTSVQLKASVTMGAT